MGETSRNHRYLVKPISTTLAAYAIITKTNSFACENETSNLYGQVCGLCKTKEMKFISESAFRCQVNSGRTCVVNSGKVYDVTDFINKHPGGSEILEKHSGEDVTQVMKTHDTHQHSPAAYRILDKYYIGHLNSSAGEVRKIKCTFQL